MEQILYNHAFPEAYDNFVSDVTKENNDRALLVTGILTITVIGIAILYKHSQLIQIENKKIVVKFN